MNRNKPYHYPPAAFQRGDRVKFYLSDDIAEHGKGMFEVAASDHCWTWLDGLPHQVSNWRLKKVRPGKRQKTESV
jgi:hypothetical protein